MKVLVTGATGFIGNALLIALKNKGHEIVVLTRDLQGAGFRLPVLAEVYPWNPEQGPPDSGVFTGVDAVIIWPVKTSPVDGGQKNERSASNVPACSPPVIWCKPWVT